MSLVSIPIWLLILHLYIPTSASSTSEICRLKAPSVSRTWYRLLLLGRTGFPPFLHSIDEGGGLLIYGQVNVKSLDLMALATCVEGGIRISGDPEKNERERERERENKSKWIRDKSDFLTCQCKQINHKSRSSVAKNTIIRTKTTSAILISPALPWMEMDIQYMFKCRVLPTYLYSTHTHIHHHVQQSMGYLCTY